MWRLSCYYFLAFLEFFIVSCLSTTRDLTQCIKLSLKLFNLGVVCTVVLPVLINRTDPYLSGYTALCCLRITDVLLVLLLIHVFSFLFIHNLIDQVQGANECNKMEASKGSSWVILVLLSFPIFSPTIEKTSCGSSCIVSDMSKSSHGRFSSKSRWFLDQNWFVLDNYCCFNYFLSVPFDLQFEDKWQSQKAKYLYLSTVKNLSEAVLDFFFKHF